MSEDSSQHFRGFADSLARVIAKYGDLSEEDVALYQRKQVETLIALEDSWRRELISKQRGRRVYEAFINHICDERKNVLTARPFFRERQRVFTKSITLALKSRNWKKLSRFRVNWSFISFAMKAIKWPRRGPLTRLTQQISEARTAIVELNLPLAISRSRIFWSRTPKSHISFMEFISIATEGLLAATDKFVIPAGNVPWKFAGVAIGRMVGNFIESYSDTMLHFYPSDKRKIYRANKFLSRRPKDSFDLNEMVEEVNKDAGGKQKTNKTEIADLIAAASTVSADATTPIGDKSKAAGGASRVEVETNISRYEAPAETRPDVQLEQAETVYEMYRAAAQLSLIDKKILRMKGLDIKL